MDIAIIGAGASGMMAAITAAQRGANVLLFEKQARAGKKLLATGNGRCNLTNQNMSPRAYHGSARLLMNTLISQNQLTKSDIEELYAMLQEEKE